MNTLTDLYAHMHWADAAMWRTLLDSSEAKENERLHSLSYHLHLVQHAFMHVWKKEPYDVPKAESFPTLEDIAVWGKQYHESIPAFLSSLGADDLAAEMDIPWAVQIKRMFGTDPAPVTLENTLLQVVMHTQYHRAQINTLLRAIGGTPAHGDLISWVWLHRPQPEWPALAEDA